MAPKSTSIPLENQHPLRGRRIVVTRPRSQARFFTQAIESLGGEALEFPAIEIIPPKNFEPLDHALLQVQKYHWVIFTSVNGVNSFVKRARYLKLDLTQLQARLAAIGPKTAQALESVSLRVDLIPLQYQAEGILEALKGESLEGKKILLPRSLGARDILPETLRLRGAEVDEIEAYRTVPAKWNSSGLRARLERREVDMITFTSSSTVVHFASAFSRTEIEKLLSGVAVACIGPITERKARDLGVTADVVPKDYTIPGLVRAIVEYFNCQAEEAKS